MKAVVIKDPFEPSIGEVADAKIERPPDAVIRITTANTCGHDAQLCEGRAPFHTGMALGPEGTGVVDGGHELRIEASQSRGSYAAVGAR